MKKFLESFTRKKCKQQIKKSLELKINLKKDDKLYAKWKEYNNLFSSWIDKKRYNKMSEYFPKPKYLGENIKDELELSNYATKTDWKHATGIDTLDFAEKTDLPYLTSDVHKLDINELKNVSIKLSNLKSKVNKWDVDKLVHVSFNR